MNFEKQKDVTNMLTALNGYSGPSLESAFPHPFKATGRKHDTGAQFEITMVVEGLRPLKVWEGSVWFSQRNECHDRDKTLGFQPDCDWAKPLLIPIFERIHATLTEIEEQKERDKIAAAARRENERLELIRAYQERFAATT